MDETGIELVEDPKEEAKESKKGVELIEKSKKKAKGTIIDDKVIEALDNLSLDDLKRDFEEEEKQQQQEEEKSFKKFKNLVSTKFLTLPSVFTYLIAIFKQLLMNVSVSIF